MKYYYNSSEGQMIFDRSFALVPFIVRILVKAFLYFPLWLTGYVVARTMLPPSAKGYYWVGCIIGVAMVIYCLLFIVKGIVIALRLRQCRLWILVMVPVVIYTCVPPAMLAYHILVRQIPYAWITWALSFGAGLWAYHRYQFLVDLVPSRMGGLYHLGLKAGGFNRKSRK